MLSSFNPRWLKNRSLRFRLVVVLSSAILGIWAIATAFQWYQLKEQINEQFDTQQVLFAERLASSNIVQGFHEVQPHHKRGFRSKAVDDDALAFAVFTERGYPILNDGRDGKYIEFNPAKGFQVVRVFEEDNDLDEWRIFWLKRNDLFIAVGQETSYRLSVINKIMFSQIWAWLLGLPLLILAVIWIINRELASLKLLERQVRTRQPDDHSPFVVENLPQEILPLVKSLNHYTRRTQTMFNRERRFTSDAAHELRSPLAGLRIQTEIAQMTMDNPEQHLQSLQNMTTSIDKISLLIEQLLTLSRLENLEQLDEKEPIAWQALVESSVAELYRKAEAKQSDIRVDITAEPQATFGKPMLLALVLRNLLDNAIKYTPSGSLIQVRLTEQAISVEDNGSGVSDEDLAKLGQPFYRPVDRPQGASEDEKGSGLGISIIKRIAELHGFHLAISRSSLGGLKFELIFSGPK